MIRKTVIVILVVLNLATVGLWVASNSRSLSWNREFDTERSLTVSFDSGQASIFVTTYTLAPPKPNWFLGEIAPRVVLGVGSGFGMYSHNYTRIGFVNSGVLFPLWSVLLLFLLYPAFACIRGPLRRHRHRKQGLCLNCGYNLTGNVTGRCPECGKEIGAADAVE